MSDDLTQAIIGAAIEVHLYQTNFSVNSVSSVAKQIAG
jgi:hypothetical protein